MVLCAGLAGGARGYRGFCCGAGLICAYSPSAPPQPSFGLIDHIQPPSQCLRTPPSLPLHPPHSYPLQSPTFGFIDDVEFFFDSTKPGIVEYRCAFLWLLCFISLSTGWHLWVSVCFPFAPYSVLLAPAKAGVVENPSNSWRRYRFRSSVSCLVQLPGPQTMHY